MDCGLLSDLERYRRRFDEIVSQMTNGMLCRTSLSDITLDFCETQIVCNHAIIRLCQNALQFTENEAIEEFCNQQIQAAQNQNNELEDIRSTSCGFVNTLSDVNDYVSQYISICRNMICRMRNCCCRCVNQLFVCQMICCLEGVICMCENAQQNCIDARLRSSCENRIEEAEESLGNLRKIRCSIGNR